MGSRRGGVKQGDAMNRPNRHDNREAAGVNLGAIITPMLDMSFQILSFFIMTYHPSAFEGHVNGNLTPPAPRINDGNTQVDAKLLKEVAPEMDEAVQVVVKAIPRGVIERSRSDGQPSQIYVKKTEDAELALVGDTDEPLAESLRKLTRRLRSMQRDEPGRGMVRLECQADLKHRYVMEIYDVCKGAGFQSVSFVAPGRSKN